MRSLLQCMTALAFVLVTTLPSRAQSPYSVARPATPSIQEVEIAGDLRTGDPGIIWADDFETGLPLGRPRYHDVGSNGGRFGVAAGTGMGGGYGVRQRYDSGQVSAGWLWRFFGDHPSVGGPQYREVWARFYHRFDTAFVGVPPKMARMGSFATSDWTLAMMAHYWWGTRGNGRGRVVADVASNIAANGNQPVEQGYNNFTRWLPAAGGAFNVDTVPNKERWVCYEMRVKLNDPSISNASYDYWADGRQVISLRDRNIVAGYAARGINAFQLDTYWNEGSPRVQERFYDHLVVATRPIGPAPSPRAPLVRKTPYRSLDGTTQSSWHLEITESRDGVPLDTNHIWRSHAITSDDTVRVDASNGTFAGTRTELDPDQEYVGRVRVKSSGDEMSDWSPWHGVFRTMPSASSIVDDERVSINRDRASALAAYPNPASDLATVTGIVQGPALHVVDALGRIAMTVEDASVHGTPISLAGLAAGVYFVRQGMRQTMLVVAR